MRRKHSRTREPSGRHTLAITATPRPHQSPLQPATCSSTRGCTKEVIHFLPDAGAAPAWRAPHLLPQQYMTAIARRQPDTHHGRASKLLQHRAASSVRCAAALSAWKGLLSTSAAGTGRYKQARMHAGLPHEPLEAASRLSRPLIWDIKAAHNQDYSAAIAGHHLPVAWNTPFLSRYVFNICWGNNLKGKTAVNNVHLMHNNAAWKWATKKCYPNLGGHWRASTEGRQVQNKYHNTGQ